MPNSIEVLKALRNNPDPDAKVLWQLAKAGADLSKPHTPDFLFDVSHATSATALAAELKALGYEVEINDPNKDHPKYLVTAKRTMVLELKTLNRITAVFEALADKYDAVFDGWGAEIVD